MSPEQRAAKAMRTLVAEGASTGDPWEIAEIARAIRAAENAAYERAAKHLERLKPDKAHEDTHLLWREAVVDDIRSLKSKPPPRKARR